MTKEEVKLIIEANYNYTVIDVIEAPRGFVAETFIITTETQQKYFVKFIKTSRYIENIQTSLPVLKYLFDNNIKNICYPFENKQGRLTTAVKHGIVIVFNNIEGTWTFDFNKAEYLELLSQIHKLEIPTNISTKIEDFEVNFLDELEINLRACLTEPQTGVRSQTQELLRHKIDAINEYSNLFLEVQSFAKDTTVKAVLTHGDGSGNVMVDKNNELFIIDWDDLLVAPKERDLWFHYKDDNMMKYYKKLNPDFEMHKVMYSFYLLKRFMDDLAGFLNEIMSSDDVSHQEKNFEDLKKDCFGWLEPLIKELF